MESLILHSNSIFVLFLVPNTECSDGGHYYSDNNHCYKLYETSVDWSVAASNCLSLTNQSQLAVIDSLSLSSFIISSVFGR